ncbi:MAG: hypothetical protein LBL57_00370 [Tannerella sp.]|nr:hypothetical protein [Tannerella sp.]
MKKVFLTWMAFFVAIITADAQQIFNVQNGDRSMFYNDLETALGEAVSGDTIYLPGGLIEWNPNELIIDKKLALIGVGADSIGAGTQITRIAKQIKFITGSDGSLITGCRIDNRVVIGEVGTGSVQDIMIFRNVTNDLYIGNGSYVTKRITVIENVIRGNLRSNGPVATECVVQNNLFPINGAYYISTLKNSLIQNNIVREIRSVESCTISNNIITVNTSYPTSNCAYNNNAFLFAGLPSGANNTFLDNLENQSAATTFENSAGVLPADVEILSGSPCKDAGTDGTDIGIYGGSSPFKKGSVPANPHISKMIISNIADSNGKIKVDIEVSAQER